MEHLLESRSAATERSQNQKQAPQIIPNGSGDKGEPPPSVSLRGLVPMMHEEWFKLRPNERQRNTEERAAKAKHLFKPEPWHCNVNAGRLPDGTLIKLDGHTRALLWHRGTVKAPAVVYVTVWDCQTMADISAGFDTFDSPDAVANVTDAVYGLCHELHIKFQSDFLRTHRFAAGLALAQQHFYGYRTYSRSAVAGVLSGWAPELMLLDEIEPGRKQFIAPVLAGSLLLLRRHGKKAQPFLRGYQHNGGEKGGGSMDAIQALFEYVEKIRNRKSTGYAVRYECIRTVIQCFINFQKDARYSTGARAMGEKNYQEWLEDARARRSFS